MYTLIKKINNQFILVYIGHFEANDIFILLENLELKNDYYKLYLRKM